MSKQRASCKRLWALGLLATISGCQPSGDAVHAPVVDISNEIANESMKTRATSPLLISGGTILTHNDAWPQVGALLVEHGNIIALGSTSDLEAMAPNARRLNLMGKTLMPGFIDSHVHVRELGMDALKADLVGVTSAAEMVNRLRQKFPSPVPGEWLIGQGWDEGEFASKGYPDRAALDTAYPDNPVLLESLHGFAALVNDEALQRAGIDRQTLDPDVGQILRRDDGTATGVLLTLAQALVVDHIPVASLAQTKQAIIAGLTMMAEAGVTSIHEAGMNAIDVEAFTALATDGQLPIRVYGLLNGNDKALMQHWFKRGPLIGEDEMLTIRGIKVFYDGSLGSRTAVLAAPYSDHPELANPTERIRPAAVRQLANKAAAGGFQMAVHAIGDEGNDRILDIYAAALHDYPDQDHRWRIEHAQVVLPDYYQRAADLGVISSMQSSHAVGDSAWAEDRLGPDRIEFAYAWQKVLAAGGRLMINSDLPGEPWTPAETLYFAVTRQKLDGSPAGGWYAKEALKLPQALHAMTLAGAYGAFQEHLLGTLAVGKTADFVLLNENPLRISPNDLAQLNVLATYVNGQALTKQVSNPHSLQQ
jgi:predicted amidohydrolase YtcJ